MTARAALLARLQARAGDDRWPELERLLAAGEVLVARDVPQPQRPICVCIGGPVPIRWDRWGRISCLLCGRWLPGVGDRPWRPRL